MAQAVRKTVGDLEEDNSRRIRAERTPEKSHAALCGCRQVRDRVANPENRRQRGGAAGPIEPRSAAIANERVGTRGVYTATKWNSEFVRKVEWALRGSDRYHRHPALRAGGGAQEQGAPERSERDEAEF